MTSHYFPPYETTSNIKVQLDLANYATKDGVKNITHVDVSSYATKTNLAALKTEVDKLDTDKLKTVPADLAKLTNAVDNDVVKKIVYNAKVTSIANNLKKKTVTANNLADITKLKAIDTSSFVTNTKFSTDTNALDDKIEKVDKKIPDVSGLATKTSLSNYLQTTTFNSKLLKSKTKLEWLKIKYLTLLA